MSVRDVVRGSWQDVRLAVRSLRASPVVAAVAILSLSLGIGANTAIFSIIDSLLLRPLPVKDPARLALVTAGTPSHVAVWSNAIWTEIHQRPELFERSAAWSFTQLNLAAGGETQPLDGLWASGSFFETLGVSAVVGRTLTEGDDRPGGQASHDGPVAVISYGLRQRRFGAAPDVVGRSLRFDDVPFAIVGVMPAGFFGPDVGRNVDVVVPLADEPLVRGRDSFVNGEGVNFLTIIARLRPAQSIESAAAGLDAVRPQIRAATLGAIGQFGHPAVDRYLTAPFALAPGATGYSVIRDQYQRPLMTILAIVAVLLLIACVNVANLLAARAIARRPELAMRLALGAPRWRLLRQLLTESAVLYAAGAALGLAIAALASRTLVNQIASPVDRVFLDVSLDVRVLLFTVAVTVVTTLLFGTVPAFRASSAAPATALQQDGRTVAGRTGLFGWLIAAQVALSLVLVVAAGLFVRTFASLRGRPFGFDADRIVVVTVDAHRLSNGLPARIAQYDRVRAAVRQVPGVAEAALSLTTPVANGQFTPRVDIEGVAETQGPVWANLISPGWFAAYGTPLVAGRDVSDRDRQGAPRVAVVNQAFARKFAGGRSPIGRTLSLYPGTPRAIGPIEIVGVVGDAVYAWLRAPAPPTYYLPLAQFDYLNDLGIRSINLSARSAAAPPMTLTRSIADAVASVDPRLSITFRPLAGQIDAALAQERLIALLASIFGGLALVLGAIGLFGVTAYAVAMRRTEIGIRMALGADAGAIERLVLARVSALVGAGIVAGVVASLWATKFVASLLYGLEARDPTTLAGAALTLAIVSACAAWLPAWRASRIDPAEILRRS